eukprot:394873_1
MYVNSVGLASRMLWAMAQPYFEILSDGSMVVPNGDDNGLNGHTQIAINIFPKRWIGELSTRTGVPIGAVITLSIIIALTNVIADFDDLVEFNLFSFFVFTLCGLVSYLILKHTEPAAPRKFEIPYGLIGGWCVCMVIIIGLTICFGVLLVDSYNLVGYALIMNICFIFFF